MPLAERSPCASVDCPAPFGRAAARYGTKNHTIVSTEQTSAAADVDQFKRLDAGTLVDEVAAVGAVNNRDSRPK